jgi:hypothetical protein
LAHALELPVPFCADQLGCLSEHGRCARHDSPQSVLCIIGTNAKGRFRVLKFGCKLDKVLFRYQLA